MADGNRGRTENVQLCKIVYFDEGSITDFMQIVRGGEVETTSEITASDEKNKVAQIEGKIGASMPSLAKILSVFHASTSATGTVETTLNTQEIMKNIVKNTILTDFLGSIQKNSEAISIFRKYKITVQENSVSYLALITPLMTMIRSNSVIQSGDFNISVDKMDAAIKNAKGYYDFIGEECGTDSKKVIFRFNIKAFKNNYKVTDLLKMDLSIFAIKVSTTTLKSLEFNNEFQLQESHSVDNPSYTEEIPAHNNQEQDEPIDVYDVLLAGIES